ncbi:MAG: bifunctional diaminohydroxyphosphoribosylaminopyrimidine deaminase/5-amino-6-(5-phosphoribosylamino)uracil reductase RibD, partial [Roseimicrobium sp.]
DEYFMTLVLAQASRGIGLTSPNPPVGAVIVKEGVVIGEGFHRKAGHPHAEIEALQEAIGKGHDVRGATIYQTLEPCCTQGRTPPCTEALIHAGIARVVYAMSDPNPVHAGSADAILHAAGIDVESGLLFEECSRLARPFTKWITTRTPYVIAKVGQSLDGRLSRPLSEPQTLTSDEARQHAMELRVRCDAILVGAQTVRRDNPHLTLRGSEVPEDKIQPWRVVVTRSGQLPHDAHLFRDEHRERTILLQGNLSFADILQRLAERSITCVLIEGGGNLLGQAFAARAVDECFWYIAPRVVGGGTMAVGGTGFLPGVASVELMDVWHETIGDNVLVHGYPNWV